MPPAPIPPVPGPSSTGRAYQENHSWPPVIAFRISVLLRTRDQIRPSAQVRSKSTNGVLHRRCEPGPASLYSEPVRSSLPSSSTR
jgi:hypothetical protein